MFVTVVGRRARNGRYTGLYESYWNKLEVLFGGGRNNGRLSSLAVFHYGALSLAASWSIFTMSVRPHLAA